VASYQGRGGIPSSAVGGWLTMSRAHERRPFRRPEDGEGARKAGPHADRYTKPFMVGQETARRERKATPWRSSVSTDWSLISPHNASRSRRYKSHRWCTRVRVGRSSPLLSCRLEDKRTTDSRTDGERQSGDIKDSENAV